jgi:hypothetical protein
VWANEGDLCMHGELIAAPALPPLAVGETRYFEAMAASISQTACAPAVPVQEEPVAWALMTNGKPNAPRIRSLSWSVPSIDSLEIAAIENEAWVPLYAKKEQP